MSIWTSKLGRPSGNIAYVPQVDGLRFLAILIVFLWHSSLRAARYVDRLHSHGIKSGSLYFLFLHGEVGVDLFFFVSGLVIAQSFIFSTKINNIRVFYLRRFIRIYPPYLMVLTACYLILIISGHAPEGAPSFSTQSFSIGQSFGASIFYLHNLIFNKPSRINPPMWSLEVEIQFYILAPLIMHAYLFMTKRITRLATIIGLIAALILFAACLHSQFSFDNRFRYSLIIYLPYFLTGILVADITLPGGPLANLRTRFRYDLALLAGIGLIVSLGLWFTKIDARPQGLVANLLAPCLGLAATLMIYLGVMQGRVGKTIFSWPLITLTGTMCYSIYLTHLVVLQVLSETVLDRLSLHNPWMIWGLFIAIASPVVFFTSLAFYMLVERPLMARSKTYKPLTRLAVSRTPIEKQLQPD